MALYRVSVLVRLETYANTEDEAVLQVARAISFDSRLAAPEPGIPLFGPSIVTINPERQ